MILERLTLRNFCLFHGNQVFDLTPGRRNGLHRPIVLFGGINGGGKTTLLDRFVEEVASAGGVSVGRGQCLEQYGEGEAYLPILEALGRLARDDETGELSETLARHAPTWVAQLAALDDGAIAFGKQHLSA